MKKIPSNKSLHERRVSNPRNQYQLVISYKEDMEKKYELIRVASRELDIQEKARKIFYRIVKEKSWIILHNLVKPFEQELHSYKRRKGKLEPKNNVEYERDIEGNIIYDTIVTEYGTFSKWREKKIIWQKAKEIIKDISHIPLYTWFEYTYCKV